MNFDSYLTCNYRGMFRECEQTGTGALVHLKLFSEPSAQISYKKILLLLGTFPNNDDCHVAKVLH